MVMKYLNLFEEVVSYTTRPMREGEKDGIDYYFVTKGDFLKVYFL